MTVTELILAIHKAVKEETKGLKEELKETNKRLDRI